MKVLIAHDPDAGEKLPVADLQRAGLPSNADVLILCVADVLVPPPNTPLPPRVQAAIDKARVTADAAKAELSGAFPSWSIVARSIADAPAFGILSTAENWDAELIVVGARQQSALARLALGSVSQKIVHNATCSVRIVKRGTLDSIHPP